MLFSLAIFAILLISLFGYKTTIKSDIEHSNFNNKFDYQLSFSNNLSVKDLSDAQEVEDFFDDVLSDQFTNYGLVGATLSVVKDNEIMFTKGFGLKRATPAISVNPNTTMFKVGSISKTFVAIAILQLVEDGLLDLDADVNTYLTEFQIPNTYPEPITLRHLLTHTAGFEEMAYQIFFDYYTDLPTLDVVVKNQMPMRVHPPGEVPSYSNYGFTLAGYIVEKISGIRFEDYIKNEILIPLNMNFTSFYQPLPTELQIYLSEGFYSQESMDNIYLSVVPAGACSSTALDMTYFMRTLLNNGSFNGSTILTNESMEIMFSNQFKPQPDFPGVNLGLYCMYPSDVNIIGHSGDTVFFHSEMCLFPDQNFGFFISYNSYNGFMASDEILPLFLNTFYPKSPTVVVPMSGYNENLNDFTGKYVTTRRFYSPKTINYIYDGEIIDAITYNIEDYLDKALEIIATDNYLQVSGIALNFVQISPNLFREESGVYDYEIFFLRNADGTIKYLYLNFYTSLLAFEKINPIYAHSLSIYLPILILSLCYIALFGYWISRTYKRSVEAEPPMPFLTRLPIILSGLFVMLLLITIAKLYIESQNALLLEAQIKSDSFLITMAIVITIIIVCMVIGSLFSWIGIGNKERKPYWKLWERIPITILSIISTLVIWSLVYLKLL